MKPAVRDLMGQESKTTQDVGRMLGSKRALDEEDFDHLVNALKDMAAVVTICRNIEYNTFAD